MSKTILALAMAAALTLTLGACTSTATQRNVAEYTDDAAVTARVKLALANTPGIKASDIQVETYRGVVQLSGFAESAEMASLATSTARQIAGVREVKNDIRMRPASS